MKLPSDIKDFPAFIETELSVEKFPEWNKQMVLSSLGMIKRGISQEAVVMHMVSTAAGAVWAINDLKGAK